MRQVFSSARLENVEAVAEMLRAEGIEVKITNDRSYRGKMRSNFSYSERGNESQQPAVWIINAEDQPRARQMLRDAGLIDSTRDGSSSYLPTARLHDPGTGGQQAGAGKKRLRIRLVLLGLIGIVVALIALTPRKQAAGEGQPAPAASPAKRTIVPQATTDLQPYRADVPTALAKKLVEDALATRKPAQACIAIDDKDPAPDFMVALSMGGTRVFAQSACPGDNAWDINVHDYITDGSGAGQVQLMLDVEDARTLEVEREGTQWRVLRER